MSQTMSHGIRTVVFPVAGLGTRFLPATKATPKEMLPVVDKPLMQYAVEEAVAAGATSLIFVTATHKNAIARHFDTAFELEHSLEQQGKQALLEVTRGTVPAGVDMAYVPQHEALGLGHAVRCARAVVGDEPFGVILPDDLIDTGPGAPSTLRDMVEIHRETGASIIGCETVPREKTASYGIVATRPHGERTAEVTSIVEKPSPEQAPSDLGVVGRYVLDPRIMPLLERTGPGSGGEVQLTDGIGALIAERTVLAYAFPGTRYDCGSKLGYIQANIDYALAHGELGEATRAFVKARAERL